MANVLIGNTAVTGTLTVNGVEIGGGLATAGQLAAIAIARMRGAGPSHSGVISATGDDTSDDLLVTEADTPGMSVVVSPGVCIVNGVFTGIAQAFTVNAIPAPSTNPRIDIIQIDQAGVITRKAGTEAGSPVAPSPDTDNMPLAEIALTTSTTEILNANRTDLREFI